jgi:hypothetical protein
LRSRSRSCHLGSFVQPTTAPNQLWQTDFTLSLLKIRPERKQTISRSYHRVDDLESSVGFYSTLFGSEPAVLKSDYAKWMLDDPRVNFAITAGSRSVGVSAGEKISQ